MRSFLYIMMFNAVMGLAYWAYQENVHTQHELTNVEELQDSIGQARNRLAILRAEWAYQNRPRRLQDLADLNYEHLQLLPLRADHFGHVDEVVFPPDPIPVFDLDGLEAIEIAQRVGNDD
jgi:hypothetical protein